MKKLFAIVLLVLMAVPSFAQYNIKKMMEEGRHSLDMGYYVVALQIFQRVLGLRPDKYDAWYLSGLSKYHLEDYKGAEDDCSHAIALNPFVVDIIETRAMARLREEKYDSAVVDFTHAIEINPDNSDYWFNRAYCYAQMHVFDIALQQLDYIQHRWPKLAEARNLRQTILATQQLVRKER